MTLSAEPQVRDYVVALDRTLVGPPRAKADLLEEVAGHLEDAVEAYEGAGYASPDAARLALEDFGAVPEVAPAFQSTLAIAASRRTAWTLLAGLGLQPFLWDGGLDLADSSHAQAPDGWLYAVLDQAIETGGGLLLLGAVLALLLTGVGHRWLNADRAVARATAWFTIGAATFVPLTAVSMTAMTGGRAGLWLLLAVLLLGPMSAAAQSARRTLAAC
ncbi:permease prefix domain 1-containing protein [Nocardioides sp. cx-169]|uniref:permease prefix domain 1-containing protein n=1 Tax=Nocardioides sp. cx-169 TaxID=2899080 RepID=UPI001E30F06E|nr:permease prefix domain 1-containing protein [Nocardioides sp. cx-169]MCD4533427.1 permease prefix domain 1-containing protein [Nocardioides sp. cx-169]